MISAAQCRAARGFLHWSRDELASRADVAVRTLVDFERGERSPISNTLRAIRQAFEAAGVTFTEDGCICPPKDGGKPKAKRK